MRYPVFGLSPNGRARLLMLFAVAALALAVWGVTAAQRDAAETTFRQSESAQLMLAGMLDQQTGVRGFALTGEEAFLDPYRVGRQLYAAALAEGRSASHGDRALRRSIDELDRIAKHWQRLAVVQVEQIRRDGPRSVTNAQIVVRKRIMDAFRRENRVLREKLRVTRETQLSRTSTLTVAVVVSLSLLFGLVGHVLVQQSACARRAQQAAATRQRREQAEFTEGMLIASDERDADALVKRHLERIVHDSDVAVIARGLAGEGLSPMTELREGSPLELKIVNASPEDCMAIRLGRPHDDGPAGERLMRCELCSAQGTETYCVPSAVGSDVVGSVLVE